MNALEITPDRSMIAAAGSCTIDPTPDPCWAGLGTATLQLSLCP